MANILPPPPVQDAPGSFTWLEWYRNLRNYITQNGSVPWSIISFAGSDLADLATRSHSSLQGLQGGSAGVYYHLTQAQYDKTVRANTIEYNVPTTGFSYTIANATGCLILKPAAGLAAGTITMPATPINEQRVSISSTQAITALTVNANAGQSITGTPTTLAANGFASWVYRSADTTWYRVG